MMSSFPEVKEKEEMRKIVGRYGITGREQVAEEVWVCDNQTITKWDGDIFSFKEHLRREIERDIRAREKGLTKER
ncbi:hypothetical protein ANCCEY_06458 [Ancylostoma ceylanicum]|uniref:Uncharacterized protein n=1 Tax=Ancylostoma ceylanicum TaxID=53326 RepID=A0A0D6LTD2_9BILA|nr:hypothetical protein ANCCEY_06458 [Ancylostoma ceylanicum]